MLMRPRVLRYVLPALVATTLLAGCKKEKENQPAPPDPFADWTPLPAPPHARVGGAMLGLRDGRLLCVGGRTEAGGQILGTDLYTPATRTWTSVGNGLAGSGFLFEATNGDVFAYGATSAGAARAGLSSACPAAAPVGTTSARSVASARGWACGAAPK